VLLKNRLHDTDHNTATGMHIRYKYHKYCTHITDMNNLSRCACHTCNSYAATIAVARMDFQLFLSQSDVLAPGIHKIKASLSFSG
jgi:hypothetical protein